MSIFKSNKIDIQAKLLYKNNLVDNIYEACTCCYNNTKNISYLEKKEYIKKRILAGHESILEHGRLAMKFYNIPNTLYNNIIELTSFLGFSKWLNFHSEYYENNTYDLIVYGNIRGYKYLIYNITPFIYDNNILIRKLIKILEENTVAELYGDINNLFDKEDIEFTFTDIETGVNDIETKKSGISYSNIDKVIVDVPTTNNKTEKSVIVGIDIDELTKMSSDNYEYIDYELLCDIIPVTVVFNNMSRTATHQLVRHRNAITQESQRYVDSSNASFTIPVPEYDKDKKYSINILNSRFNISLDELAKELLSIYGQLQKQGLKKEEARAFLPSNVNCGRLYMTFTLKNLITFLHLRLDKHAQYEIRKYAESIDQIITKYNINKS